MIEDTREPPDYWENEEGEEIDEWDPGPPELDFEDDEQPVDYPKQCPHGNQWGECAHCDHEGDMAFDAARERRMR